MPEYDFRDNLVTLSRFNSPTEAAIARSRLAAEGIDAMLDEGATATWLNHVGPDLVGASLSVRQGDLRRAREILHDVLDPQADDADDELSDYDADDWSGEDWSDDEDDEPYDEAPPVTPPLTRAFRASILGLVIVPPLLSCYALWVLLRHCTWQSLQGDHRVDWRFYATLVFVCLGLLLGWLLWVPR